MRFNEFQDPEKELAHLRETLRRKYPDLTEEQLDELLPAIPAIAMGAARLGGMAAKGAMKAGSALAKGVGKVAKTVGGAAKQVGTQTGNKLGQMAKQAVKNKVSGKLSLGGRTEPSAGDLAQQALAQQDAENQAKDATYAQMIKDLETQVQGMKKALGVK